MLKLNRISAFIALTLVVILPSPASAQGEELRVMEAPFIICELPQSDPDMSQANEFTEFIRGNYDPSAPSTASIVVTYNGFPSGAMTAFEFAVDIWEQHITSNVPIQVVANWVPLGAGILGSASSNSVFSGFSGQPVPNTWYPNALADALAGFEITSGHEINASFNSTFPNWYFGTDGNPLPAQFDLVTIVLHELGHGLGFFGSMEVDDGTGSQECDGVNGHGCWDVGPPFYPIIFDRFAEDGPGVSLIDTGSYPNPSAALGTALTSNNVNFDGASVVSVLATRGPLYAPSTWNAGSSYSHWNESSFPAGTENSLLTPFVSAGEAIHTPGPATCALLEDIGWPLGTSCASIVANEPEATITDGVTLGNAYPNPFKSATNLTLRVTESQTVRATLYDLLGRQLAVLFNGPVAAGSPLEISVNGAALQPAVYFVRIEGESFMTTQRIVRAH